MAKTSKSSPTPLPSREPALIGPFRKQLAYVLERQGWGPKVYSVKIGHDNNGLVSLVLAGDRKVPLENLRDWLDVLEVSESEYASLYLAALSDYAPSYVLDIINTAEAIVSELGSELVRLSRELGDDIPTPPTLVASIARRRGGRRGGGAAGSGRAKP